MKKIDNTPVVGLTLDLDFTVYDADEALPTTYIPAQYWNSMLNGVAAYADSLGVDFKFGIITSKPEPDDITESAANNFQQWLYCCDRNTGNQFQYTHVLQDDAFNTQRYFACQNQIHVLSITSDPYARDYVYENSLFTNFHISLYGKENVLAEFADTWQADRKNIFHVDDNIDHITAASSNGFSAISAQYIHDSPNPHTASIYLLLFIEKTLKRRIEELSPKLQSGASLAIYYNTQLNQFTWGNWAGLFPHQSAYPIPTSVESLQDCASEVTINFSPS